MLFIQQLELISTRLSGVFNSSSLFGGKLRLLFCGDPMQLPPVGGTVLYYNKLDQCEKNDPNFQQLLTSDCEWASVKVLTWIFYFLKASGTLFT